MAKTLLEVKIVTPDKKVLKCEASKVCTETEVGKIEFLINHAPSILSTVPCETTVVDGEGVEMYFFTSKGVISIDDNVISLCCDSAETVDEIDIKRAEASKERALRRMSDKEKYNYKRACDSLLRAEQRIKLKEHSQEK